MTKAGTDGRGMIKDEKFEANFALGNNPGDSGAGYGSGSAADGV
jgi:hypothetical protein